MLFRLCVFMLSTEFSTFPFTFGHLLIQKNKKPKGNIVHKSCLTTSTLQTNGTSNSFTVKILGIDKISKGKITW